MLPTGSNAGSWEGLGTKISSWTQGQGDRELSLQQRHGYFLCCLLGSH